MMRLAFIQRSTRRGHAAESRPRSPLHALSRRAASWGAVIAGSVLLAAPAAADNLEERVQRLEDREEIRDLIVEYGRALDARDFAAFAALFAEHEGEWIGGLGRARGRAAIRELMEATIGSTPPSAPSFHLFANDSIGVDGDSAEGLTKWVFVVQGEDGDPRWLYLGHYRDTFVREDGRWRFLRRQAFTDIPAQTASQ